MVKRGLASGAAGPAWAQRIRQQRAQRRRFGPVRGACIPNAPKRARVRPALCTRRCRDRREWAHVDSHRAGRRARSGARARQRARCSSRCGSTSSAESPSAPTTTASSSSVPATPRPRSPAKPSDSRGRDASLPCRACSSSAATSTDEWLVTAALRGETAVAAALGRRTRRRRPGDRRGAARAARSAAGRRLPLRVERALADRERGRTRHPRSPTRCASRRRSTGSSCATATPAGRTP